MTVMNSNAVISPDGLYRYCLVRRWTERVQDDDTVLWVMLNPSTADATTDDNTIRKITKFSKAWGYGSLAVVNLFALRSRHPEALVDADDPIGPDNMTWINNWMTVANQTVAAWGASFPKELWPHVKSIGERLRDANAQCLGLTRNGHPRHPLYLSDTTKLMSYDLTWRQLFGE